MTSSLNLAKVFLSALSVLFCYGLQAQKSVQGVVKNELDKSPLSYCTISVKGTFLGATSDVQGRFFLQDLASTDSIQVSYVGFDSKSIAVADLDDGQAIFLSPSSFQLQEIIVRPLSPTELLRKVKRDQPQNSALHSFNALAHYEEAIYENRSPISHSEAVFQSWFSDFQRDPEDHHQLALFRELPTEELEFMKDKAKKEKEKYLRKNPDKASEYEGDDLLLTNFGGPSSIMGLSVTNGSLESLDSNEFKRFKYRYLPESTYEDRRLIVIGFESKGVVDQRRSKGKVFIDSESLAIVSYEEEGDLVIPAYIRPILFVLGMNVKNPTYSFSLKYRAIEERWYPQYTSWSIDLGMVKKHLLKKNQKSDFQIAQHYAVSGISTKEVRDIPKEKRFDSEQKMKDQIHSIPGITWSSFEY